MFGDSPCPEWLTNLDAKGAKRSVKMWTENFYKTFSKNILLYLSSRLSKIRLVHTYVMARTVYFGWICTYLEIRGAEEGHFNSHYGHMLIHWIGSDISRSNYICLIAKIEWKRCAFYTIKIQWREKLPREPFLQIFKIHRAFFRLKQVGKKHGKFLNPIKIAHNADFFLIYLSL